MNISPIRVFSENASLSFIKDRFWPFLTSQQVRIKIVVGFAMGAIATAFLLYLYERTFDNKPKINDKNKIQKILRQDGQEEIRYPDGRIAVGKFSDKFELHGQGILQHLNHILEGEFENGRLKEGKWTFPDGVIEEGEFREGHIDGKGKQTFTKTQVVAEGFFSNGQLLFQNGNVTVNNIVNPDQILRHIDLMLWGTEVSAHMLMRIGKKPHYDRPAILNFVC